MPSAFQNRTKIASFKGKENTLNEINALDKTKLDEARAKYPIEVGETFTANKSVSSLGKRITVKTPEGTKIPRGVKIPRSAAADVAEGLIDKSARLIKKGVQALPWVGAIATGKDAAAKGLPPDEIAAEVVAGEIGADLVKDGAALLEEKVLEPATNSDEHQSIKNGIMDLEETLGQR